MAIKIFFMNYKVFELQNLVKDLSKIIMKWIRKIISYFDEIITNKVTENINNKLKLIKRYAYDFIYFDNFRTKVLLSYSNY